MFSKDCKFELTEEQYKKIADWDRTHDCTLKPRNGVRKFAGPIGGELSVTFTPTTIGMVIAVKCACNKRINVSGTL